MARMHAYTDTIIYEYIENFYLHPDEPSYMLYTTAMNNLDNNNVKLLSDYPLWLRRRRWQRRRYDNAMHRSGNVDIYVSLLESCTIKKSITDYRTHEKRRWIHEICLPRFCFRRRRRTYYPYTSKMAHIKLKFLMYKLY